MTDPTPQPTREEVLLWIEGTGWTVDTHRPPSETHLSKEGWCNVYILWGIDFISQDNPRRRWCGIPRDPHEAVATMNYLTGSGGLPPQGRSNGKRRMIHWGVDPSTPPHRD